MPLRALILVGLLAASCAAPTTVAPAPTPTATAVAPTSTQTVAPTVVATVAPTPTATFGPVPGAWASACGQVSDFVSKTGTTVGSMVLNSPGRTPLKIKLYDNPAGSAISGYICAGLLADVPDPAYGGIWPPNTVGFVPEGTLPATKAGPAPTGFVLPQACAFVRQPELGADQTYWWVDCGAQLNRDARGTLGTALVQQGWTRCGPAAATEAFYKGTTRIVVVESSLAPGDYPRFSQRPGTGCS